MAVLQKDLVEVAQALQADVELKRVFRALAKLSGGPLLEVARMAGVPPGRVKSKLERLEELNLAARAAVGAYDDLSVYYHLTRTAYRLLAERPELL